MTGREPTDSENIVAVSFLTAEELKNVGTSLKRIYPLPDDGAFDDLLKALDRAAAAGKGGNIFKLPLRRGGS